MGARAYFMNSPIGKIFGDIGNALKTMFAYDGDMTAKEAIEAAIKANPGMKNELEKIKNDIESNDFKLYKQAEERFGKDEDGYNPIPNKLEDISVEIPEEEKIAVRERIKAQEERTRGKDGKQRIR